MVAALRAYLLLLVPWVLAGWILPPPDPVQCSVGGRFNCTVTNTHGSFNDRKPCRAAEAAYPRTEAELVAAVARAVRERRKAKAATKHSHSFPKLACPGGGRDGDGTVISTARLDRVVRVDAARRRITVEGGVLLRELIREAAAAEDGAALLAQLLRGLRRRAPRDGSPRSSLMGKGGAVHEYVVGLRIVTPAGTSEEGGRLAVVRELGEDDPDLNAAKVSLGVLGVVSQVTLQLEPLFKRAVTFVKKESDADLAELVATWGRRHEFGEIMWMPGQGTVVLRMDDRVDVSTPGDGANNNYGPRPIADIIRDQEQEDRLQEEGSDDAICRASRARLTSNELQGFGFTNDGESFTGYPIVGYQHRIQASGACLRGSPGNEEDAGPESACVWDPRIHGTFIHNPGFSVPLSNATAFVSDLLRLRDLNGREAFCGLDMHRGGRPLPLRGRPAAHVDAFDEMEQMALYKRFPRLREFLDVKARFDPDGVFSSEWSDQVLGVVEGSPVFMGPGCAVDGLCTCTEDAHCAPGYVCSSGKVYPEARVCSAAAQPQGASTAQM
ncbi:hypothetical protein EJB05_28319, partial [Eragrostis curvula]